MKTFIILITIFLAQLTYGQHHHRDAAATHGMFFFGTEKIYLSHLPMFHNPHDYQVLFEVEIPEKAKKTYLESLKNYPQETMYTLVPEDFVLPEIAQTPRPFSAQLYFGHFERGGTPLTDTIKIDIKKVLYFQKFDPAAKHPELAQYILIGNQKEQFLIHKITAKPDFDSIAQTELKTELLLTMNYVLLGTSVPNNRPLEFMKQIQGKVLNGTNQTILFSANRGLYTEFGDLAN